MRNKEWLLHIDSNNVLLYNQQEEKLTISMFSYTTLIYKIDVYRDFEGEVSSCLIKYFEPFNYIRMFLTECYDNRWKECNKVISNSTSRAINKSVNAWISKAFKYERDYIDRCKNEPNKDISNHFIERRIEYITGAKYSIENNTLELQKD